MIEVTTSIILHFFRCLINLDGKKVHFSLLGVKKRKKKRCFLICSSSCTWAFAPVFAFQLWSHLMWSCLKSGGQILIKLQLARNHCVFTLVACAFNCYLKNLKCDFISLNWIKTTQFYELGNWFFKKSGKVLMWNKQ